jgi:hypothetical protein
MNWWLLVHVPPCVRHLVQTDLASVHALVGDEGLGVVLEPVWLRNCQMCVRTWFERRLHTLRKVTLARGAPVNILSVMSQKCRILEWALTTTGIVDNLLYDTPDVSIALRLCQLALCPVYFPFWWRCVRGRTYEVERAELRGGLVQAGVGREDRAATLSLVTDDTTHGVVVVRCWLSMEDRKSRILVGRCGWLA